MKKSDYSNIREGKYRKGFLMFIQTMEELLFYYSYESYKLPALNSHFLCLDMLSTKQGIDEKIITEGNFNPLTEEFEEMVENDIFFAKNKEYAEVLLHKVDKIGNDVDYKKLEPKAKIKKYADIAASLCEQFELKDNDYFRFLYRELYNNIFVEEYKNEHFYNIMSLSKQLATELVNYGYSTEYIFYKLKGLYNNKEIDVNESLLAAFFSYFSFDMHIYKVVYGINSGTASFLKHFKKVNIISASQEDRIKFGLSHKNDCLVELKLEDYDEYSAASNARNILDALIGFHRISQHYKPVHITDFVRVYLVKKEQNKETLDKLFESKRKNNVLERARNESKLQSLFYDGQLQKMMHEKRDFINAIILHNNAIDDSEEMNQLLNLWSAVEVLIDFKHGDEEKINVICNCMTRVLNREYLYRQVEQLYKDIKAVIDVELHSVLDSIQGEEKNELKLSKILAIDSYNKLRDKLISMLDEYPLLQTRMLHLSENIFKDSNTVYNELMRHKKKVQWQIMRIYRNRNMIVHNGKHMPYLNVILGNLHYYLDCLMNTLMEYYYLGYESSSTIYFLLEKNEMMYHKLLGQDSKAKNTKAVEITEDNYKKILFNGYVGSLIKKAVQEGLA